MEKENQLYELGYHLVPTVGDEGALSAAEAIKKQVASHGGEVSLSEEPKLMDLAYPIEKRVDAKKRSFNSAYFGWMNIYMSAEAADKFLADLRANDSILRHLLIKKDTEEVPEEPTDEDAEENGTEENMSADEMDKAIDELVQE